MKLNLRLLGLLGLAALVIAFFLRDVVEQVIVRPAAYLFWLLGLIYRYIPQPVLWFVFVIVMFYLVVGRLVSQLRPRGSQNVKAYHVQGPVEEVAMQIERKEGGIYFKWQIARTLARIAMDLQEMRMHQRTRRLDFEGQKVNPEVRRYLDAGFNNSFSDYSLPRIGPLPGGIYLPTWVNFDWLLKITGSKTDSSRSSTPFDINIGPVIDYLESEMENNDDHRRS